MVVRVDGKSDVRHDKNGPIVLTIESLSLDFHFESDAVEMNERGFFSQIFDDNLPSNDLINSSKALQESNQEKIPM